MLIRPTRRDLLKFGGGAALLAAARREARAFVGPSVLTGQTMTAVNNGGTATVVIIYPSTPTSGNLLLVFMDFGTGHTVTPPSGWTAIFNNDDGTQGYALYGKIAGSSEAGTYTWNVSGGNDYLSGIGYEISGAASTVATAVPSGTVWTHDYTGSTSSQALGPVTPTVLNMLPIAFAEGGSAGGWWPIDSVSPGTWSIDNTGTGQAYVPVSGVHGPVTTDTTTAISPTITTSHTTYLGTALILVAPASGAVAKTRHSVRGN